MVAAVNGEAGGVVSVLVGAIAVRLAITGDHLRYVRPSMGPWLLLAGVVLMAIGGWTWFTAVRRAGVDDAYGGHHHRLGVGWLLVLPVITLLLVAPPALGAYGVDRAAPVDIRRGELFEPLPAETAPRPMTVLEFVQRAYDRDGASMAGRTIELTGFVAEDDGGEGFRLARYGIACCAADAQAAVVRVFADGHVPPRDQWVQVTGSYRAGQTGDELPVLVAQRVVEIDDPVDPYE
jgi:uncharacterized repeat protein (TIGR03943 family)